MNENKLACRRELMMTEILQQRYRNGHSDSPIFYKDAPSECTSEFELSSEAGNEISRSVRYGSPFGLLARNIAHKVAPEAVLRFRKKNSKTDGFIFLIITIRISKY
jgi:hypothetical protein